MTKAEKYFFELMKDPEFKESFLQEKLKLDLEYKLEDLKEKIKSGESKTVLLKRVNQIKRALTAV